MCFSISYTNNNPLSLANRYKPIIPKFEKNELERISVAKYYFVSGFEFPQLPIIKENGIYVYQWGLIPRWVKDSNKANDIRSKTLNAVGETIFEKPSFKSAINSQRCILPINGFFEWREVSGRKIPYFIRCCLDGFLSIGCVYEQWVDKQSCEIFNTFSVVTTEANELMKKIHNTKQRMPLILKREDESKWIDKSISVQEIKNLIKPLEDGFLDAYTVDSFINNLRNDRNKDFVLEKKIYDNLEGL